MLYYKLYYCTEHCLIALSTLSVNNNKKKNNTKDLDGDFRTLNILLILINAA